MPVAFAGLALAVIISALPSLLISPMAISTGLLPVAKVLKKANEILVADVDVFLKTLT